MILYQTRETLNTVAGLAQEMYLGEACARAESDPIPPGEGVLCPYPRWFGSESTYHAFQASFHRRFRIDLRISGDCWPEPGACLLVFDSLDGSSCASMVVHVERFGPIHWMVVHVHRGRAGFMHVHFLVPWYPFKSGLIHKHTVKHTVHVHMYTIFIHDTRAGA